MAGWWLVCALSSDRCHAGLVLPGGLSGGTRDVRLFSSAVL